MGEAASDPNAKAKENAVTIAVESKR